MFNQSNLNIKPVNNSHFLSHVKRMGLNRHGLCALFALTFLIDWDNNFILDSVACSRLKLSCRIMAFKCCCL